jgi:hypothetical protein
VNQLKRRPGRPRNKRSAKIAREVRVSPILDDVVWEIVETERRRYPEVGGMLMLLGAGVWRRLREHPHIRKGFAFDNDAALLLLAQREIAEEFFDVQADEADRVLARSHRFNERSEFYK